MPFFLACVGFWAITIGNAAGSRPIGGYEIHELHGPFASREEAEATTCAEVVRDRVGAAPLRATAERVIVQASDEEDVRQQLIQLSMQQYEQP